MKTRSATSACAIATDAPVGATGGLYAFAGFYLDYAYIYFFLLTAGGR